MENKLDNINDLVINLAAIVTRRVLNIEVWQFYGFKKIPQHGYIWEKIFPKAYKLEKFIEIEILAMGFLDVLNGIKKTNESQHVKLQISLGVLGHVLTVVKTLVPSEELIENIFSRPAKKDRLKHLILTAEDALNENDFKRFFTGTLNLFSIEQDDPDDYFFKSDAIKDIIERSSKEGGLVVPMSDETKTNCALLLSRLL
jgi:hypothetical protein